MITIKKTGFDILLFGAAAVLLTFIQVPHKGSFLAWVAWVPFVYACKPEAGRIRLWFVSYFTGVVYWLINVWWIGLVALAGPSLFQADRLPYTRL